jgi:hypothetical protein
MLKLFVNGVVINYLNFQIILLFKNKIAYIFKYFYNKIII